MPTNIKQFRLVSDKIKNLFSLLEIEVCADGRKAVFFDVDGTLSRDDSLELLINAVIKKGLLDSSDALAKYNLAREEWLNHDTSFDEYLQLVIALIASLKGLSEQALECVVDEIMEEKGRYYLFPWLALVRLKMMGYKLIALSGAPDFLLDNFMRKIGIFADEMHSTKYIFKDGVFTGEIDFSVIKDKGAFIMENFADKFDLSKCIALGDTVNDAKMFNVVGKAVAINPTEELAEIAKQKGLPVVVERKNLVLIFPKAEFPL